MRRHTRRETMGVTLTELLVVLAIIGLLATIAIPVYVQRTEEAKVRTTQQEVREIAKAEEMVAMIHGFYVPIQMLDDVAVDPTRRTTRTDDLQNETDTIYLIDPFVNVFDQIAGNPAQPLLQDRDLDQRVHKLYYFWQGPFLNPTRVWIGDEASAEPDQLSEDLIRHDHPLDPWGQPYRMYSPAGIVGSAATALDRSSFNSPSFSNGRLTTNDDRFDRFAIVSYGRDNQSDGVSYTGDDIFYYFGILATESMFRAF
jgi:prepilin-type N-terminal cleavage/methylation domain-containing protein